ncbi:hypothetical protein [Haloarchaeobius sp. TZWWS8]|uniref:hypothetical protein n=1 Tax=Haloarchaeobius sp. TZWWS8 TaxID=3446121 RepID=UPI003EBB2546
MYESALPQHGYIRVTLAFLAYAFCALFVAVAAAELGATGQQAVYVFIVAALALLKWFLPVFRRLVPGSVGSE